MKIPETFAIGDREDLTPEKLLELLETMYTELAVAVNRKPDIIQREIGGLGSDGLTTDAFLSNGDININVTTLKVEILTEHTDSATVVWQTI